MTRKVLSGAIVGLNAQLVEVEIDLSYGLQSFSIVGLPDKAIKESEERVNSAIKAIKFLPPHSRTFKVLVNLAPADLKKEGSLYDLPIALAFLLVSKQIDFTPEKKLFVGELSLNGELKPIKGALSFALLAQELGLEEIILPVQNAKEASLVKNLRVIGAKSLIEVISHLEKRKIIEPTQYREESFQNEDCEINLSWIRGQEYAKRALTIAAAGGHNLFMYGPPGSGKSILAKALPSILPELSFEEILEVTKIYSIAGLLPPNQIIKLRPFRAPHHTSSEVAIIGGGNPLRPGEVTLSHRGVLFLDEFPEFHRDILESLRQPLEEGKVSLSRAKYNFTFPSRFMLVAAANPCPCGYLNDPNKICTCSPSQIAMYKRKLSGPLIDRIDLFIHVPALKYEKLIAQSSENESEKIKEEVKRARQIQKERFKNMKIFTNAEMGIPEIKKFCQHDSKSHAILQSYVNSGKLSARGYHRVLRVARTIADLSNSEKITSSHIAEALMYRVKE